MTATPQTLPVEPASAAPPASAPPRGPKRLGFLPALEGIRGVALFIVLTDHIGLFIVPRYSPWLVPGGFVYLVEGHPFVQILDAGPAGLVVARDYFDTAPQVEDYPYTYTDGPALSHSRQVEFQHGLGEIVTSLAEAALRIEFVHEHDFELFARFDSLQRQEDGTYRLPAGQPRVPMMYSLRASMPGRRYATG